MSDAAMELVLAWIEAVCSDLPPKKRVARLRRLDAILERKRRISPLRGPSKDDGLRVAHDAFREVLPKLMAP